MQIIPIRVPDVCQPAETEIGSGGPLPIGYVGESGVRQVALDFSPWAEAYGPGALTLMVKRQGDANAYPVLLTIEGNTALWTVSSVDTHVFGVGKAQYMYVIDENNVKSAAFQIFVDRAVSSPSTAPPDPYEGWVQALTELGAETLQNAQDAAQSAGHAAEDAESAAQSAGHAAEDAASAETDALKAEGWAVGKQNGQAVESGSPYYQNNAAFYAEAAQQGAEESGFAFFDVDVESGEMFVTVTANLAVSTSFAVNENLGILEVTVQ